MNRIFASLVAHEFMPDAFNIQQIPNTPDLARKAS